MATNWVDEILSGATSSGSKTLSLTTGSVMSVANSSSESLFTVTSDTTNGGFTSILGIENQEAVLFLGADNADDAADVWEIQADTSGNFKIGNRTSGTSTPARWNTITNAITIDTSRNITVGVDDTGYDVKFFGATSGQYLLWDESADELVLAGDTKLSFHDAAGGENIIASADGHLEINAGTTLDITAPTVDINASTELNIDGDVDLNGDLDVSGTATIGILSLAHITGSNFEMAGSGSFTTNLTANGDVTFGNASTDVHAITGKTTFTGPITASGAVSSSGTITGDKLSITSPSGIAATITTASFDYISSSLIPGNDDVQSLGSSTKEWKDLYIDGVAYIDSASITNTDITKVNSDLTPTVTNLKDLGTSALQWKD